MSEKVTLTLKQTPLLVSYFLNRPGIETRLTNSRQNGRGYFVPNGLSSSDLTEYTHIMDWIERYATTLSKNPKLRPLALDVTSYAKLVDLRVTANKDALTAAAYQLRGIDASYFKNLSLSLIRATGKSKPPTELRTQIDEFLVHSLPAERDPVVLVSARPLNEFDIMPELSFGQVQTGIYDLEDNFSVLKYKDKANLFNNLIKAEQNVGILKYEFEVIVEPAQIAVLSEKRVLSDYVAQRPSPAYGYDVDHIESDDTTIEMLQRCYDMSLKLYGLLQSSKQKDLDQLAVLGGHRQRHLIEIDIEGVRRLGDGSLADTSFTRDLKAKIATKHPLLARYYFGEI